MNYYPHHIGDYARDTAHLSMLEDAAYRRMLDLYYASERVLPKNRDGLYRLVRARSAAEKLAVDVVLGEFFQETEAGWRNARADIEIGRAQEKSSKAKASAHASVEARQRTGKEVRAQRMAAAKAKGTHTDEDWLLLVDLCGKKCVKCGADSPLDRDHVLPVYKGGSDAITNLQPLCAPCNSSKGPEAFDYVPPEIRSTFAQRSLNEGSTTNNQEPRASSQKPVPKTHENQKPAAVAKPPRSDTKTGPTEMAYSEAYNARYGVGPVINSKVRGMLARFVERVPMDEAPNIARFYVGHNRGLYVSSKHCIDLLLRDAEGVRTEWATGRAVTQTEANQADRTAATANAFAPLIAEAEERERIANAGK